MTISTALRPASRLCAVSQTSVPKCFSDHVRLLCGISIIIHSSTTIAAAAAAATVVVLYRLLSRHLLACTGTGVLMRWFMPPPTTASASRAGTNGLLSCHVVEDLGPDAGDVRKLHELRSRSALVGVCYDEGADTVSAVSRLGHLVVAHGVKGLRL